MFSNIVKQAQKLVSNRSLTGSVQYGLQTQSSATSQGAFSAKNQEFLSKQAAAQQTVNKGKKTNKNSPSYHNNIAYIVKSGGLNKLGIIQNGEQQN